MTAQYTFGWECPTRLSSHGITDSHVQCDSTALDGRDVIQDRVALYATICLLWYFYVFILPLQIHPPEWAKHFIVPPDPIVLIVQEL